MEKNLISDPLNAGLFGADAGWSQPPITVLFKQFGWFYARFPASFAFPFRLPYLELSHCFHYNPIFYIPEKPNCQRAFRVPTYSYVQ